MFNVIKADFFFFFFFFKFLQNEIKKIEDFPQTRSKKNLLQRTTLTDENMKSCNIPMTQLTHAISYNKVLKNVLLLAKTVTFIARHS